VLWQLQQQQLQAGLVAAGCQVLLGHLLVQQRAAAGWQLHRHLQRLALLLPAGMALLLVRLECRQAAAVTPKLACSGRQLQQGLPDDALEVALSCGAPAVMAL
jgi:hypothetical protein